MNANLYIETLAAYGVLPTTAGARAWQRRTSGVGRPVRSAGEYAAVVRRLGELGRSFDGRLLAVGYNRMAPTAFVDQLERWLAYWRAAVVRPDVVGSSHNATPDVVWSAYRAGVPSSAVRHLPREWWCDGPVSASRRRMLARAARAMTRARRPGLCSWSLKAIAALGRLSPELQYVALESAPALARPIRISDVNWARVAEVQRQMQADPTGRVRVAWAVGRRSHALYVEAGGQSWEAPTSAFLAPAYPRVDRQYARLLARGATPVEIAAAQGAPGLSKAEAHWWLSERPQFSPAEALAELLGVANGRMADSVPVVRWLAAVERDPARREALYRERTTRHEGHDYRYRFADRLDEIREHHLTEGVRSSVQRVFERAAREVTARGIEAMSHDERILAPEPEWWRCAKVCFARSLITPAALAAEGKAMDHCVASYVDAVRERRAWIVSLDVCGERSTVQFRVEDGSIVQHRGPANSRPGVFCARVLDVMSQRIVAWRFAADDCDDSGGRRKGNLPSLSTGA